MENIEKELERLKKQIDEAKANVSNLEGQETVSLKQLKEAFGITAVEGARKELAKMDKSLEDKKKVIETRFERLKTQFAW